MDPSPSNVPFNTQFLFNQLCGTFCGRFDYVALIFPTFVYNKTLNLFAERYPRFFVMICEQHRVEI